MEPKFAKLNAIVTAAIKHYTVNYFTLVRNGSKTLNRSSSSSSASKMAAFPANGRKSAAVKLKAKSLFVTQMGANSTDKLPSTILKDCKSLQNISLHNNPILTEEFQQMEGFQEFEARRRKKFDKQIDSNEEEDAPALQEGGGGRTSRKEEEDDGRRRRKTEDGGRRTHQQEGGFGEPQQEGGGGCTEIECNEPQQEGGGGRQKTATEDGDGRRKMEGGACGKTRAGAVWEGGNEGREKKKGLTCAALQSTAVIYNSHQIFNLRCSRLFRDLSSLVFAIALTFFDPDFVDLVFFDLATADQIWGEETNTKTASPKS
ncbi:hypothetical protein V2J09_011521 [Rumex salicifolius]